MKKINLFGLTLVGLVSSGVASAAVDPTVLTAVTDAGADALTIVTALTVAAGGLIAAYWMYRAINKAK